MKLFRLFTLVLLLLSLLVACDSELIVEPPFFCCRGDTNPINARINTLSEGFQTSQAALAASQYQTNVDDYPVTVFVFSELDTYLADQNLSKDAFLASPKLNDFVATTMLSRMSIFFELSRDEVQTFETLSGDDFVTSNSVRMDDYTVTLDGVGTVDAWRFQVADTQEVVCLLHLRYEPPRSGALCTTTRPFVEFDW
ncbi:MAG: hypothetical protein AAF267_15330 [Deinococcota bacterium]